MPESVSFEIVLSALREGRKAHRAGWNGAGQFVTLQTPDEHSKMTLPYLYLTTVDGARVPWVASHTDLLAEDWVIEPA